MLALDNILFACLIRKSQVCCLSDCWSNLFLEGHWKPMKVGPTPTTFSQLDCLKFYFVILFSFELPMFDAWILSFENHIFPIFKRNLSSKCSSLKCISKIHLKHLESKSFFKIICNHILIDLHPSWFSMKILVLSKTRIQARGPK